MRAITKRSTIAAILVACAGASGCQGIVDGVSTARGAHMTREPPEIGAGPNDIRMSPCACIEVELRRPTPDNA